MELQQTRRHRLKTFRSEKIIIIPFSRLNQCFGILPKTYFTVSRKNLEPSILHKLCKFHVHFLQESDTNNTFQAKVWKTSCKSLPFKYIAFEVKLDVFPHLEFQKKSFYFLNVPKNIGEAELRTWVKLHLRQSVKKKLLPNLKLIGEERAVSRSERVESILMELFDLELVPFQSQYNLNRQTWRFTTSSETIATIINAYKHWYTVSIFEDGNNFVVTKERNASSRGNEVNLSLVRVVPVQEKLKETRDTQYRSSETYARYFLQNRSLTAKDVSLDPHLSEIFFGPNVDSDDFFDAVKENEQYSGSIFTDSFSLKGCEVWFSGEVMNDCFNGKFTVVRSRRKRAFFRQEIQLVDGKHEWGHAKLVRLPNERFSGLLCFSGQMFDRVFHGYGSLLQVSDKMRFLVQGEFSYGILLKGALYREQKNALPLLSLPSLHESLNNKLESIFLDFKEKSKQKLLGTTDTTRLMKTIQSLNKDLLPLMFLP